MIIDTHTHFYDNRRPEHCWPPEGSELRPVCLPVHYKELACPEGVTGTVIVEASPQMVDNEWILSLAENDPFLLGFVGNIPPGDPAFRRNLDRLCEHPKFVGIRDRSHQPDAFLEDAVLDDLRVLSGRGFELDLLSNTAGLKSIPALHQAIPDLRIVINHIAGVAITGDSPDPDWCAGMKALESHANVFCKVSGLVEGNKTADNSGLETYLPVLDFLWDVFGDDRVIYGSNWPVSERFADYATVQRIPAEYVRRLGEEATRKYFYENARSAYRWPE